MGGLGTTFSTERFISAIPGSAGIISTIAKRVGCDWHTVKKWIDTYPTVKRAWQDEREKILDLAETKCIEAINNGDGGMIRFYLCTQGKQRGYVERQEVTGADSGPVTVKHDINADTARTIFDILAATGAVATVADESTADEVHPA